MVRIFNLRSGKQFRRSLRKKMPDAEVILWSRLQRKQLGGFKFRRQYGVGGYSIDFYCPRLKLAVEVDGPSHFETGQREKDLKRQAFIESLGIRMIRFSNEEVYRNLHGVLMNLEDVMRVRAAAMEANEGVVGNPLRS